jgi:hypothetical protein
MRILLDALLNRRGAHAGPFFFERTKKNNAAPCTNNTPDKNKPKTPPSAETHG